MPASRPLISFLRIGKKRLLGVLLVVSLSTLFSSLPMAHFQPSTSATAIRHQPPAGQIATTVAFQQNVSDLSILPSSSITMEVDLANAQPILGFRTVFTYNTTVLRGTSLDYSNSIFGPAPVVAADCIDATSVSNPSAGPCPPGDGPGTVDVLLTTQSGTLLTQSSGALFRISFNVLATSLSQFHFTTVVLLNGSSINPAVRFFDGYFSNKQCGTLNNLPFVCQPPIAEFTVSSLAPPVGTLVVFNATSSLSPNPSATITSYLWSWDEAFLSSTLTPSPVVLQGFCCAYTHIVTLKVTDSYGVTGLASIPVQVVIPGPSPSFSIRVSPNSFLLVAGNNASAEIELQSLDGFSGTVGLTTSLSQPPSGAGGVTISLASNSLKLSPDGTNSTVLKVSTLRTTMPGIYSVGVIGTSGSLSRAASIPLTIPFPSFELGCDPIFVGCQGIFVVQGSNSTIPVLIESIYGFVGTVTLTSQVEAGGITASLKPTSLAILPNETVFSRLTVSVALQTPVGFYATEIEGKSGTVSSFLRVIVKVVSLPPPDFTLQTPPVFKVSAGANRTLHVSVVSQSGFSGAVSLVALLPGPFIANGPMLSLASSKVTLSPDGSALLDLVVSTTQFTQLGRYAIVLVGFSSSAEHVAVTYLTVRQ